MAMGGKRPKGNMEAVLLVFREKKRDRTTPHARPFFVCVLNWDYPPIIGAYSNSVQNPADLQDNIYPSN
jgi:hypothetical protein